MLSPTPASIMSRAARAAGISTEKDEIRASLAGKRGTVLEADDGDQTAKVRVTVQPAVGDKPSEVSLCSELSDVREESTRDELDN